MRKSPINPTIKDAFKKASEKSEYGRKVFIEAKKFRANKIIGTRIHALKSLAHDTFIKLAPQTVHPAYGWDKYTQAKPEIRKLGVKGGEAYDNALQALKFAWVDSERHQDALKALNIQ